MASTALRRQPRARPSTTATALATLTAFLALALTPAPASALWLSSPDYQYVSALPGGYFEHTFALFAPDPLTYNVSGPVWVDESDATFCSPASNTTSSVAGKVVVAVRDSKCDFRTRAVNAEAMGAVALVIGDNVRTSNDFMPQFLGPFIQDPPLVRIPVIFVLASTMAQIWHPNVVPSAHWPHWETTTARIDQTGLAFTLQDYYEFRGRSAWEQRLRTFFNLSPFIIVILCYWAFFQTYRRTPRTQPQQQPQPQQQQQQQQQAPVAAVAVDVAPSPAPVAGLPSSSSFSEREMAAISLPVPPHLSDDGGAHSLSDVPLEMSSSRSSRSRGRSVDEAEGEGLMASSGSGVSSSSSSSSQRDSGSPSVRSESNAHALAHPLLPSPSVATSMLFYHRLLQLIMALGKPRMILRVNAAMYAFHVVCSVYVLAVGFNQVCVNENLAITVSLWCARALIGFRIVFWQTHSATSIPTCVDVFFKNWADCIYLFTGSMFTWNDEQRSDCEARAPTTYHAVQLWTILIYITYILRVILYLCDKYSQRHSAELSYLFTISSRSFLSLLNGGFSCAGALDKDQPATQLDLMLIPTATFAEGMYPADDAVCGVCLSEYQAGETLRVLHCSHHFHQQCVDTWLLQKSNCPTCRSALDVPSSNRRAAPADSPVGPRGVVDVDEDDDVRVSVEMQSRPIDRPPSPSQNYRPSQLPEPL